MAGHTLSLHSVPFARPARPSDLGDRALLNAVRDLVRREHGVLAELLTHLMVIDERRLWAPEGFGSFFDYCRTGLGYSEAEAYRRSQAARLCRRLPRVLEAIIAGRLHLSAVCTLAPHLSPENVDELMDQAQGLSKRELEAMLAARSAVSAPRPGEVRQVEGLQAALALGVGGPRSGDHHSDRPGPSRGSMGLGERSPAVSADDAGRVDPRSEGSEAAAGVGVGERWTAPPGTGAGRVAPDAEGGEARAAGLGAGSQSIGSSRCTAEQVPSDRAGDETSARTSDAVAQRHARLAERRISVRATPRLLDALERARALMGHHPGGNDPATVLERALELLVGRLEQRRFGAPTRGARGRPTLIGAAGRAQDADRNGRPAPHGGIAAAAAHGQAAPATDAPAALTQARRGLGTAEERVTAGTVPAALPTAAETGGLGWGQGKPGTPWSAVPAAATKIADEPLALRTLEEPAASGSVGTSLALASGHPPPKQRARGTIPAWVRRAVYERDRGRCTFLGDSGHVCGSRDRVELHHRVPWAHGGAHSVENLALHCRTHNALQSELDGLGAPEGRGRARTTAPAG